MNEPLENLYFDWLCAKVMWVQNPTPSNTYWRLLRHLHNTEFVWVLEMDENRAHDGWDLRPRFLTEARFEEDEEWLALPVSIFEVLYAFAEKAEFQTDRPASDWFWAMLHNLGLGEVSDANTEFSDEKISDILETFVWRTYHDNGSGGLFPMRNPDHDQTKVEIWYQFCEYLVDNEL